MSLEPIKFDPRTKLFLFIYANFIVFVNVSFTVLTLSLLYFIMILCLLGKWKMVFIYTFIFFGAVFIESHLVDLIIFPVVSTIISVIAAAIQRFLPYILAGIIAFTTTRPNEWITTFKKMGISEQFTIPATVLFRFFPTVVKDYRDIRNAMKFRGIATSNWALLRHPIQAIEHIFVPLLMNATNTADDLTAASLSRGLSNPGKHTTYAMIKWRLNDALLIVVPVCLIIYHFSGGLR